MNVAVIGAGKMGLPLACQIASRGATVVACDANTDIVAAICRGECPIDEPGVAELLSAAVRDGSLRATTDTAGAAADSDVVLVIVPVLLTPGKQADLSIIEAVSRDVARGLHPGQMISYETTLPVGGTRGLAAILETGGLTAGEHFDLVFSPERVKSRLVLERLSHTSKVVGGITPRSAARAAAFYRRFLGAEVIDVGSLEAAEFVKLTGMVYRDVNIALANELARYAESVGVDFQAVRAAANTDGEAAILAPGIGVGGHCTPVYPSFLINDAHERSVPVALAEQARRINEAQPAQILDRLERSWQVLRGRRVLILGLGFRPEVKEHTCSPAFVLQDELRRRGAHVRLHDPLYSNEEIRRHGFTPGTLAAQPGPEVIVLNTAHAAYAGLDFAALAQAGVRAVVDGRGLWDPRQVRDAGLFYLGIGRPGPPGTRFESKRIELARPSLHAQEAEAAAEVVRGGWVTQGPQVAAMEREFAQYVGARYACAVSSGTAALHLALLAIGVRPGDEVVTVSHSFIATANSVRHCGAVPVFIDVEPDTYSMDPERIEAALTPRTRAILCVHQMGMPCDVERIIEVARRYDVAVVEDAACAVGSEVLLNGRWERIGRPHGDVACFSFHPRKIITTGEGGMITTGRAAWDRQFRLWRHQGMDVPDVARHAASTVVFESYPVLGYNYRLTDIQAAIGREQLKRLPVILERRRMLAHRYHQLLADVPGIETPHEPTWARTNWQSYCIRLPEGTDQRCVMQYMLNHGIATRRGIMCSHREGPYADADPPFALPVSEQAQDRCLVLPLHTEMSADDQARVVAVLKEACAAGRVAARKTAAAAASPPPEERVLAPAGVTGAQP